MTACPPLTETDISALARMGLPRTSLDLPKENTTMTTTADLLDEYGRALRGSWGDIDGRSEKLALLQLSAAIREHGSEPLTDDQVRKLRDDLNVCSEGGGHWEWYCSEEWMKCEPEGDPR